MGTQPQVVGDDPFVQGARAFVLYHLGEAVHRSGVQGATVVGVYGCSDIKTHKEREAKRPCLCLRSDGRASDSGHQGLGHLGSS